MNTLQLTDEQLILVQNALDFYSRIGIGQFNVIKDHPTFEKYMYEFCTPKKTPEVGDRTPQGEILEIKDGKALINGSVNKKTGHWQKNKQWKKLKDVKLSTDYTKYHKYRDLVDHLLIEPRNVLINDSTMHLNGSWGIHHKNVHNTCRMAFDIVQVIRHERWKLDPKRSHMTVDSSIHFTHREDDSSSKIKCNLNVYEINGKIIE